MDSIVASGISQSVAAMSQVLQMATNENMDLAEKLIKVTVETALGEEWGKGDVIDVTG